MLCEWVSDLTACFELTSDYCLPIVSVGSAQCIHVVCSLHLIGTSLMMWSPSDLTPLSTREETHLTCKRSFSLHVTCWVVVVVHVQCICILGWIEALFAESSNLFVLGSMCDTIGSMMHLLNWAEEREFPVFIPIIECTQCLHRYMHMHSTCFCAYTVLCIYYFYHLDTTQKVGMHLFYTPI